MKRQKTLQLLMNGVMLLVISSCITVIKEPVKACVVDVRYGAECGKRNLNYKHKFIGEWVGATEFKDIRELQPMQCFDLEAWYKKIKPSLKESHELWSDSKD